ncbi:hypothetical protein AXE65_12685 [Ventosimonas gracilis]|uniref:Bacterial sugar transferase domain-containing protein n=1 Tax=Ventosimonas gracilis TaxID=1680762 RepID=A0A139SVL1_9GAMM|nr:sugar transferase [Ventosimonas gracilis]KXU38656.1 hypothetical protein AXE65_12685 [Ventosimonas gracilis]
MYRKWIKRLLDIISALIILLLLMPILLLLMLLVAVFLGRPVFFKQTRPGYQAVPFQMIKFRTMTDAHNAEGELLPDAQRLTRFGKFLRATSLDELPELWNVLKGEMSLVGPRPLLMEYLPLYSKEQMRRHEVKPGITGWAQVNGRNAISWTEKFNHDIFYVSHYSFCLDIKILLLTCKKVFIREGITQAGSVTAEKFTGQGNNNTWAVMESHRA